MCLYIGSAYPTERNACVSMCVQSYIIWSLILHMCVFVCQCLYPDLGGFPCHAFWNLPCGSSTEHLLSPQSSLSSSAPFPLKKNLSVFLSPLPVSLGVIRCFMLMLLHGLPATSYPRLSDTTALSRALWRLIQTHKVAFRVFPWCTKPSCQKNLSMKLHFMLWKLFVSVLSLNPDLTFFFRTFSLFKLWCHIVQLLCSSHIDWLIVTLGHETNAKGSHLSLDGFSMKKLRYLTHWEWDCCCFMT